MGGRDHACPDCGRGGLNDPDGECECTGFAPLGGRVNGAARITAQQRRVLRTLGQIGGEVAEAELVYHRGEGAIFEAFELAEQGLITVRTTFELTPTGGERS